MSAKKATHVDSLYQNFARRSSGTARGNHGSAWLGPWGRETKGAGGAGGGLGLGLARHAMLQEGGVEGLQDRLMPAEAAPMPADAGERGAHLALPPRRPSQHRRCVTAGGSGG